MAEYLELVRAVLEKRETDIAEDTPTLHLNERQCSRLWRSVRVIHGHFSGTLSYLQPTWPGLLPILKEFYLIVTRANSIPQQFSSARSWLQAAVFHSDHRQAFKQLTQDLQDCVHLFHETIESFIFNSGKISKEDMDMDGDYEMDLTSLKTGLQPFVTPSFSGDENEKQLAEYIVEREKGTSSIDNDQDHASLPQFYTVMRDYPTSGEHIGGGAFGAVYKVNWLGMTCAKKHFNAPVDENLMTEFMKEVNALGPLNNPHIVKLLCTSNKTSEASFLMEHMPMSLHEFITERWNLEGTEPFTILAVVDIMQQIARGMEYLHEQHIVHRDLKSSNILVAPSADEKLRGDGYADVKLADFGLAKVKVRDNTRPTREKMGTTRWRAPEAFAAKEINWKKADVYSFAMTYSEILIGEIPFKSGELAKLYERITTFGERPELPSTCPELLANLLQDCWKTKFRLRPSFTEIREKLTIIKGCLLKVSDAEGAPRETVSPSLRSLWETNSRGAQVQRSALITNTVEPWEIPLREFTRRFTRRQNIFIVIFIVLYSLFCGWTQPLSVIFSGRH